MKRISPPTRAFRRVLTVFVAIAGVGAFALPHAEAADNSLVTSTPAANSTVETSPPSLLLTFANALGATNTVEVVCNGSPYRRRHPAGRDRRRLADRLGAESLAQGRMRGLLAGQPARRGRRRQFDVRVHRRQRHSGHPGSARHDGADGLDPGNRLDCRPDNSHADRRHHTARVGFRRAVGSARDC